MPSFTYSPASLEWNGGSLSITPVRLDYIGAALSWASGGSLNLGPNLGSDIATQNIRLDRLTRNISIAGSEPPTLQFQALWQRTMEAIEAAFAYVNSVNASQQVSIDAINAALALASSAKQQAEATDANLALVNSKTDPIDGLLTATSDGVITVSAHNRVYADVGQTTVAVSAGSVTNAGPYVRIYYVDAARTGGAVTYLATTDEITQTGNVHIIGGVAIPAAGDPPSEGTGTTPPGYVRNIEN